MTYKSSTAYAWSSFVGILLLEIAIDYFLRISSNNLYEPDSGIPSELWFLPQTMAAIIGGYFIFRGLNYLKKIKYKIYHVAINLALGIVIYTLIVFPYVVSSGRGSL